MGILLLLKELISTFRELKALIFTVYEVYHPKFSIDFSNGNSSKFQGKVNRAPSPYLHPHQFYLLLISYFALTLLLPKLQPVIINYSQFI